MAGSVRLNADQIAALFLERLPRGGWLTAKQTAWLQRTYQDEVRRVRGSAPARDAGGVTAAGDVWSLHVSWNGAGNLQVITAAEVQRQADERDAEAALREVNERVFALLDAGDRDGAMALNAAEGAPLLERLASLRPLRI